MSLQSVIAFSKWSATWRVARRRKQMTDQRLVEVATMQQKTKQKNTVADQRMVEVATMVEI